MRDGHPLIWLLALGTLCTVTFGSTSLPVALLALLGLLVLLRAVGPTRQASARLGWQFGVFGPLLWLVLALVVPGFDGSEGGVLFTLPAWNPGPGVSLGGPVGIETINTATLSAIRIMVVGFSLGLAGQLVPGRAWHALAQSVFGQASSAFAPWCYLGEAAEETESELIRAKANGWPRPSKLSLLFTNARALADAAWHPAPTTNRVAEQIRLVLFLTIVGSFPILLLTGKLPTMLLNGLLASDLAWLWALLLIACGLILSRTLPGPAPHSGDLALLIATLLLGAAWYGRAASPFLADSQLPYPLLLVMVLFFATVLLFQPTAELQEATQPRVGRHAA